MAGRWALLLLLVALSAMAEEATEPQKPLPKAEDILKRVWANRVQKDFSLKARLFVDRDKTVPVEILIKNLPDEVRTIYRGEGVALLVVQSQQNLPRYYLAGTGELAGAQRAERFLGAWVNCYDLGMPFLYWPDAKCTGEDRMRGQDCYTLEMKSGSEPYRRVKIWIHQDYFALLRVEAFDADENPVKRIGISSFKKIGDVWIPRGMDFAFVPGGQALPATERSRLEVYEGNYDAKLPVSLFDPYQFGSKPSAASN